MKLFKYKSYIDYVKLQIRRTNSFLTRKVRRTEDGRACWADSEVLDFVIEQVKDMKNLSFGICHGVRFGQEVDYLAERLTCNVIGTEISSAYKKHGSIIRWDFHKVKDEWVGNTDFIYTNALDHTFDPDKCINQWMKCIKSTGKCFIEWTVGHESDASSADPFSASLDEYSDLFKKNGYVVNYDKDQDLGRKHSIILIVTHNQIGGTEKMAKTNYGSKNGSGRGKGRPGGGRRNANTGGCKAGGLGKGKGGGQGKGTGRK